MVKAYFLPHPSDQMSFTLPFKGATSLFAHLGKLGLNISNSTFVFSIRNHPCFFMVIIMSFVFFKFDLSNLILSGFHQFKGILVRGKNNANFCD